MEDAEQIVRRREIRRKKILENSDARWKKIMGLDKQENPVAETLSSVELTATSETKPPLLSTPEETGSPEKLDKGDHSEHEQTPTSSGSVLSSLDDITGSDAPSVLPSSRDVSERLHRTPLESRTRSLDETCSKSCNRSVNGTLKQRSASNAYAFPKKVSDAENRSYTRSKVDLRSQAGLFSSLWETLEYTTWGPSLVRALIVSVLAMIVWLCLALGSKYVLIESIFLPFLLLEIAIYSYPSLILKVTTHRAASHSILSAALMLCGIAPAFASKATSCLNILSEIFVDSTVYFFSFIMFHVICVEWN